MSIHSLVPLQSANDTVWVLSLIVGLYCASNQKDHEQITNRFDFAMQYILHCSYSVMQSCWESAPESRPQFSELVSTISDILQSVAGYVELAMSIKQNKLATES